MRPVGNKLVSLSAVTLMAASLSLTGCQTFKNLTNKNKDTVETAEKSEQEYYQTAISQLEKGRSLPAIENLTNLRTFYPTGRYAEQALLDLMYVQYDIGEFENAAASANQFISLYPSNPQISYAHYVRGVANMEGSSEGLKLIPLNQAERDTSYYRLAFANFQELLAKYPNSPYAPDAAQRMTFIYNQFAESEIKAANWYIEREAYVAAANRAKWVFQYYPLSESTPEALAILAYSNDKLGLTDLANEYKTLLQLNYPDKLTANGSVRLDAKRDRSLINKITFGKLGRNGKNVESYTPTQYNGATKTQVIRNAAQLQLPPTTQTAAGPGAANISMNNGDRGVNVGLGLPPSATNQASGQGSASAAAKEASADPRMAPAQ
ncbi:outer membrane protein assembly factor BamD [Psychrobacter arenosus]|jgi:outer membrane protein assembly factor BamD|uniref:outer membrane protein assembly factor BamD n=1 Tax=Psychrobacter arenosus TaxID=256326 RepID=UPI0019186818|nr:outer membrane protein assembly factor BamD [Psychrobacter arenosus]